MDKKQLYALIDGIVADVMAKNGLEEGEARVFVGVALRQNREAFIQTVCIPKLAIAGAPAPAETADAA